jgi:chitin disaccharide deacetylase
MTEASGTPTERVIIPHIDDVGNSHSANVAMMELGTGTVSSGSLIVPASWFPEIAHAPNVSELDLGVHLTLTSESAAFRWGPISTTSRASGLVDDDGYMWSTVPPVREHAHPEAVEGEMRAQIDRALGAGIDITHLDHHMGAALAPEFVDATIRIAAEYSLPVAFPSDIEGFLASLAAGAGAGSPNEMGDMNLTELEEARRRAGALAVGGTFLMGLTYQREPNPRKTFERLLSEAKPGITYLSLHASAPGDIEHIHPNDHTWRVAEYDLFGSSDFGAWLAAQPFAIAGMREYRDRLRSQDRPG